MSRTNGHRRATRTGDMPRKPERGYCSGCGERSHYSPCDECLWQRAERALDPRAPVTAQTRRQPTLD